MTQNTLLPSINYSTVKPSVNAVNLPKLGPDGLAIEAIRALVGTQPIDGLTPFGHKINSMSGNIDMAILQGCTTLNAIATHVGNPATRKSNLNEWKSTCTRVHKHLKWMAENTNTHGSFRSRLAKVHAEPKKMYAQLRPHLTLIFNNVNEAYSAAYSKKGKKKAA